MKNLLNIDDQVKINMPGVFGDGEIVKVTQIDVFNEELYYMGAYHQNCSDGGEGYDNTIQFKEGQYKKLDSNEETKSDDELKNCNLNFGQALDLCKKGIRIAREGWNGKGMWVRIVIPGGDNKEFDLGLENSPYAEMKTADNKLVPWLPSQADLLAEDWVLVYSDDIELAK